MYKFEIPFDKIDRLLGSKSKTETVRWEFIRMYLNALTGQDSSSFNSSYTLARGAPNSNSYSVQIYKEHQAYLVFNTLVNYDESFIFFPLSSEMMIETLAWLEKHCTPEDYYVESMLGSGLDLIFTNRDKAMQYKLTRDVPIQ